jgi:hypothetical protein
MFLLAANHDFGPPIAVTPIPARTEQLTLAVALRAVLVMCVLRPGSFTQVAKSVAISHPIAVINLTGRPTPSHVQPSKPLGKKFLHADLDVPVTVRANTPRDLSFPSSRKPSENTGFRVVGKNFAETIVSEHLHPG